MQYLAMLALSAFVVGASQQGALTPEVKTNGRTQSVDLDMSTAERAMSGHFEWHTVLTTGEVLFQADVEWPVVARTRLQTAAGVLTDRSVSYSLAA